MESFVSLVTGSRKGIGKYLAEHYVGLGHQVIGCSRAKPDWTLNNYRHFELDVTDEVAVQAMFRVIRKDFGRLDHLINNAGIASMNHSLLVPASTVQRVLNTNVVGTFLFSREAAKLMQTRKWGRIINFSTVAVPMALEGEAAYVASKAGVVALTRVMARELAPWGITVNAVGPTMTETDLIRSVPQEKIAALLKRQAIARMGKFDDLVNVVDFFLRRESDFVTGQTIYLGGVS
jgi:3-oxoacyl-[acyl-carrier protein] reductase